MLHKFKVEQYGNSAMHAEVSVDDKRIRCRGYNIRHFVDEVPTVELEICAITDYENEVEIKVSNKTEIASLMDKSEFEKFCEIWKEIHNG